MLAAVAAALAVATVLGMVALRPTGEDRPDLTGLGFVAEVFSARVVTSSEEPCPGETQEGVACRTVSFELDEGPDSGRIVSQQFVGAQGIPALDPGDEVILAFDATAEEGFRYRFVDRQRTSTLLWLALVFAGAVVVLGRLRGLAALAGLAASLLVLVWFVLPAILDGRSAVLVAVVGAAAIAYLALYLAHGFTLMTTVALLGTLAALALTVVLATVFVGVAELTGFASEEATAVQVGAARIDLAGILLGGVVIGALGAIDDMTVTQASAVWELRAVSPLMSQRALIRSGLRIGRDHVASTVNTLALAYAGASLPVLLLLVLSRQSVATVLSGEVLATEIVRTLVGSIGLVAAVPVTTWLAAMVAPSGSEPDRGPRLPAEEAGA